MDAHAEPLRQEAENELALQRWSDDGGAPHVGLGSPEGVPQSGIEVSEWQRICDETEDAHAAILTAVHSLESNFLLVRADAGSRQWPEVLRRELLALLDFLEVHSASSELPSGLIGQIEAMHGRSERVTALVANHREIVKSARALQKDLARVRPEEPISLSKRKIAYLTAAIREHEGREMDLIYETDSRVIGGEG